MLIHDRLNESEIQLHLSEVKAEVKGLIMDDFKSQTSLNTSKARYISASMKRWQIWIVRLLLADLLLLYKGGELK